MKNEKSVVGFKPQTPFIVRQGHLSIEIRTESDGYGGSRHCFYHPLQKNSNGTRRRKVHSKSLEIIKKLAGEVLKDCIGNQQTLTRKQFLKLSTVAMGRPMADVAEFYSMMPAGWKSLLPALTNDELRLVALLISEIHADELKRLGPNPLNHTNGLPASVHIAPQNAMSKGTSSGDKRQA